MRHTEDFVKKVLEKTDIVKLIGSYTKLHKKDDVYIGKCVFHKGTENTLTVRPDKQSFHCFDCGKSGNAAVFLMEHNKISHEHAVNILAKKAGIHAEEKDYEKEQNMVLKSNLYEIYKDAALFYRRKLMEPEGEDALSYLKGRELTDKTIETFKLGFSPSKGNSLYKYLKQKGYEKDLMVQAGLVKISENGPYDMFRGRVMFPIIDAQNRVIAFSGRVMDPEIKPKYLNSPESPIFNKGATLYGLSNAKNLGNVNYFILCEGQMDVIALHQAGFRNAVAGLGTAFTPLHVYELQKYTKNAILSYDGDEPGQKAAMRAIKELSKSDMGVRVLSMDPYKDPDEFIKALGKNEYKMRINRSIDQTDFQLRRFASQFDLSIPEQKQEFLSKAVDLIMEKQDRQDKQKDKQKTQQRER